MQSERLIYNQASSKLALHPSPFLLFNLHTAAGTAVYYLIMASLSSSPLVPANVRICLASFMLLLQLSSAQLSQTFYATSCPNALSTIKSAVNTAVATEARMGASLLRLHFHDCFVNASLFFPFVHLFFLFVVHACCYLSFSYKIFKVYNSIIIKFFINSNL